MKKRIIFYVVSCNLWSDWNGLFQYDYQYDKNSNITYERERFNYANNVKDEEIYYTYNNLNQLIKSEKTDNLTYKTTTSAQKWCKIIFWEIPW